MKINVIFYLSLLILFVQYNRCLKLNKNSEDSKKKVMSPELFVSYEQSDRDEVIIRKRKEDHIQEKEQIKTLERIENSSFNSLQNILSQQRNNFNKLNALSNNSNNIMNDIIIKTK
ncbi:MAG: hypothetical protein MJ252_00390 [archaeon]|nr:hypothetical protein [archaeon]